MSITAVSVLLAITSMEGGDVDTVANPRRGNRS